MQENEKQGAPSRFGRNITIIFVLIGVLGIFFLYLILRPLTDEERLQREVATDRSNSPKIIVRGKITGPDGTQYEDFDLLYKSFYIAKGNSIPFMWSGGGGGNSSGGVSVASDGSFKFEVTSGSNVIVYGTPNIRSIEESGSVFRPLAIYPTVEDNEELDLRLEKAIHVHGVLLFDDGRVAPDRELIFKHHVTAAKGAGIAKVDDESVITLSAYTDSQGRYSIYLWPGEFTFLSNNMPWETPRTKKINVPEAGDSGNDLEANTTSVTPLELRFVLADGTVVSDVWAIQKLIYRRNNDSRLSLTDFRFHTVDDYISENDRKKERHFITLAKEKNFISVVKNDNEYGIVTSVPFNMMGQKLDLQLKPMRKGTVKLVSKSTKQPLADTDITIVLGVHLIESGHYEMSTCGLGNAQLYRTDPNGNLEFKVPVFEQEYEEVFLHFEQGDERRSTSGSGFPVRELKKYEKFGFKPLEGEESLDLGTVEID